MRRAFLVGLLGVSTIAAAPEPQRLYLHVDGVQGEARAVGHAGWVEITSLRIVEARGAAHEVLITKAIDHASPHFFTCSVKSCDLGAVMVDSSGAHGTRRMTFVHASLTNIVRGHAVDGAAQETLTLHFEKIEANLAAPLPNKLSGPLPMIKDDR